MGESFFRKNKALSLNFVDGTTVNHLSQKNEEIALPIIQFNLLARQLASVQ